MRKPDTVLVVEDEALVRLLIADELRRHGLEVIEVSNADEAYALLQRQIPIDLVFTDIRMPGSMDGIALAQLIHETRPELKLIVTSGNLPPGCDPELGLAEAFVQKPYDIGKVIKQVEELLANRG